MAKLQLVSLVLSVASFLIPLSFGYKKRFTLLWAFIFTSFFFDILLIALKWLFHCSLFPAANTYVLIEFLLLSSYYNKAINTKSRTLPIITVALALLYIAHTFYNGITVRNGTGTAFFYILYVIYALLGFYTISQKHQYEKVTSSGFFWVNVAILLGSSGRVILFLFEDYLGTHQLGALAKLWLIYKFFNVLINILFAIALTRRYE